MAVNVITDDSDDMEHVPSMTCTQIVYKYFSIYIGWEVIIMV